MISGSAVVDIADPDVRVVIDNMMLGYYNDVLGKTREPITDKYGDDIEVLENAIESFVRTRS